MAQIQFSLIKKKKIGRPEHLVTPTLLHLTTSYFCFTPLPQSGRHKCITPNGSGIIVHVMKCES